MLNGLCRERQRNRLICVQRTQTLPAEGPQKLDSLTRCLPLSNAVTREIVSREFSWVLIYSHLTSRPLRQFRQFQVPGKNSRPLEYQRTDLPHFPLLLSSQVRRGDAHRDMHRLHSFHEWSCERSWKLAMPNNLCKGYKARKLISLRSPQKFCDSQKHLQLR